MGAVQYFGNAAKVYVASEAVIGLSLGLVGGAVWKNWHWSTRKNIEKFYAENGGK